MAIFVPERGHPDAGMARAIVRDSTDVITNGSLPFFLDSNGCVSNPDCGLAPRTTLVGPGGGKPCWERSAEH